MNPTVLIAEHRHDRRCVVAHDLRQDGFRVEAAGDAAGLDRGARAGLPRGLLIDVDFPQLAHPQLTTARRGNSTVVSLFTDGTPTPRALGATRLVRADQVLAHGFSRRLAGWLRAVSGAPLAAAA